MRPLLALISVVALGLMACGGGDSGGGEATDDEIVSMPSTGPKGSLGAPPANERTVTGVLGFDDIEGGCAFVDDGAGTRYEVVYPEGWVLDRAAAELRADDGRVVRFGETLTIRGTIATDRMSICQIGPIFVATAVEPATP